MWEFAYYVLMLAFVAAAIVGSALLWRSYQDGSGPGSSMFRPKVEPRLDVVAQSNVDGRRRLVLIRRDDTEHLIMTGGPIDVVIETGIPAKKRNGLAEPEASPPVFARQPRSFGQSSGET